MTPIIKKLKNLYTKQKHRGKSLKPTKMYAFPSRVKQELADDFWESTEYQKQLNSFISCVRSGLHFTITPDEKSKITEIEPDTEFKPTAKPYSTRDMIDRTPKVPQKSNGVALKIEPETMVVEALDGYEDAAATTTTDERKLDSAFEKFGERMTLCHICGVLVRFRRRRDHAHLATKVVYYCAHCNKSFNGRKPLRAHLYVKHFTSKALPCDQCGKIFGDTVRLKYHMGSHRDGARTNSGVPVKTEKSECPICHSWVVHIKQHMLIHYNDKKFPCQYCAKAFNSKNHLNQHLAVHSGAKDFKCRFCPASFGFFSSQRNHEKRIHSELFH